MYTIGQLARQYNLSRSTLIYYDGIGLLKPSNRSKSNYRMYSEEDAGRLEQICLYRKTGLPVESIKAVLDSCGGTTAALLEKRLKELNGEITRLREQQHFIVRLLKNDHVPSWMSVIKVETWISLLESMGFGEDARQKWHSEFEIKYPEEHQQFLEALGLPSDEIARVRELSAAGGRR